MYSSKTILLIEPAKNHRDVYQAILSNKNFSTIPVKHDFIAKQFLTNNKEIELVIIGCCVPPINTFDIIQYVKSTPELCNVKILKLSPSKNIHDCLKLLEAGADDYIRLIDLIPEILVFKVKQLFAKAPITQTEVVNNISTTKDKPFIAVSKPVSKKKNLNEFNPLISIKEVKDRLKKSYDVKAIPYVVSEVLELTSSINSDMKQLIQIVELDPALTSRVLRCANSSHYRGNQNRIYKLIDAVKTMGFNGLKNLVIGMGILDSFGKNKDKDGLDTIKLWYHSLVCGVIAKEIATLIKHPMPDNLFISGLLHDLGIAIFNDCFSEEYKSVLKVAKENEFPLKAVESKLLNMDHSDIAYLTLEKWKFSKDILFSISEHNKSFSELLNSHNTHKQEILITKLSNCLTKYIGSGIFDYESLEEIPNEVFSSLGLKNEQLNEILLKSKESAFELMQVMLLHIDSEKITDCNDIDTNKCRKEEQVLFFNQNSDNFLSYEIILKQLDYCTFAHNNMFSLPKTDQLDTIIINLPENNNLQSCFTILKTLKKKYPNTPNISIWGTEETINEIIKNKNAINKVIGEKDLLPAFSYLVKPLSIKNIVDTYMKSDETKLLNAN